MRDSISKVEDVSAALGGIVLDSNPSGIKGHFKLKNTSPHAPSNVCLIETSMALWIGVKHVHQR